MSWRKKLFWTVLSVGLAALSIWAVMSQSRKWSLAGIVESLRSADPVWLLAALVCTVLFVVLEGAALGVLLKGIGHGRPFSHCLLYSTSDIYFSAITSFKNTFFKKNVLILPISIGCYVHPM